MSRGQAQLQLGFLKVEEREKSRNAPEVLNFILQAMSFITQAQQTRQSRSATSFTASVTFGI